MKVSEAPSAGSGGEAPERRGGPWRPGWKVQQAYGSQKPGPLGVRDAGEEPRLRSSHMSRSTRGTIKVPLTAD